MAEQIGSAYVAIGADVAAFEAGMNQVQADLGKLAAAADTAGGRYVDAQGRMREANGRFVSSATLAAEAAASLGGSLGTLGGKANQAAASINGGLVASFAAYDKAIKPLNEGLGRLGEGAKSAGQGLSTYVTLPLTVLAGASVAAFGKIESLGKGLQAIAQADLGKKGVTGLESIQQASQLAAARLQELQDIAKAPGIGFEQAVAGDIRLRAVGISAAQSAKSMKEFANAIATTGGGAAEFDRVTTQLSQLSAKGKVLSQDLRPIIEAAPAVSQALLKLYGTIDSETISASLAKQGKSSQDFIAVLTDELAKMPRVTGGIANSIENAQQGIVQDAAKIGESLNKAFDLQGLLDKATGFVDGLTAAFVSLDPTTQKLIFGFAAGAAAAGPLLYVFGSIAAAIPSVVAGLEALGLASTVALGPIGIGVAAVAAAAYLIIDNWGALVDYFTAGEGGRVFSNLAESVTNSASVIKGAFSDIGNEGNFSGLVSASGIFKALFRDIAVGLTSIANVAGGAIGSVTALLRGNLTEAANQGERALYGLIDPLANLLGFTVKQPENNPILVLSRSATEFNAVFPQLKANLDALNGVKLGPLVADPTATAQEIGLLEALRAKLKDLKDQREKETTVGAITVDNAAIKAVEEQIKKLEGVDKAGKKATDAITKLRQELARLTALDGLLGDTPSQVEVLDRRAAALSAGLKSLVDAGVSPGSRAFKGFIVDLVNTSQALDNLRAGSGDLNLKPINVKSLIPATIGDTLPQDVARLLGDYAQKPYVLPVPIRLDPIAGGLTEFSSTLENGVTKLGAGFTAPLLELSKNLQVAKDSLSVFGGGFDEAGARAQALQQTLSTLLAAGVSPLNPQVQQLSASYREAAEQSQLFQLTTQSVAGGLSALGQAIGNALVSGGDVFKAILGSLLAALGDFVIQYGETVVLKGIADIALGNVGQGTAELIGGTALVAGGAVLKGVGGAVTSSGAAGGTVTRPGANYNGSAGSGGQQKLQVEVVAEFRLRGQDMVALARTNDYRVQRTN